MKLAKGTPASSQIIWLEGCVQELEEELAEVKRESLKLSALVVERDYQITLANKGYDYEGAVEDARHYKEVAEKYKAELAAYRLWAEVEITDLRHDRTQAGGTEMKRTGWYGGWQKPVRVGEYERDYWLSGDVLKDLWDGRVWVESVTGLACRHQRLPWRGLKKEEK